MMSDFEHSIRASKETIFPRITCKFWPFHFAKVQKAEKLYMTIYNLYDDSTAYNDAAQSMYYTQISRWIWMTTFQTRIQGNVERSIKTKG